MRFETDHRNQNRIQEKRQGKMAEALLVSKNKINTRRHNTFSGVVSKKAKISLLPSDGNGENNAKSMNSEVQLTSPKPFIIPWISFRSVEQCEKELLEGDRDGE